DLKSFTLVELKDFLKQRNLSTKGSKNELINRLLRCDLSGTWLQEVSTKDGNIDSGNAMSAATQEVFQNDGEDVARIMHSDGSDDDGGTDDVVRQSGHEEGNDGATRRCGYSDERSMYQREIEIYRREKELAERELVLARREIELLRRRQDDQATNEMQEASSVTARREEIAGGGVATREVTPSSILSTKANITAIADLLSYFSGDSDIFETWDKQIRFLRTTYKLDDSLTKILIGMRLKGRATEWFHSKPEYIGMTADQLLDGLRGMFYHRPNKIVLKRRFEERMWKKNETFHDYVHAKVILANRIALSDDDILEYIIDGISDVSLRDLARVQGFTSRDEMLRAFDEITLRDKGGVTTATSRPGEKSGDAKRKSDNDITIMRADAFIKIGSPPLENIVTPFRGVGTEENATLGRSWVTLTVDGNAFRIFIHVVSDNLTKNQLLLGRDFLDTIELHMKRGEAVIKPL
ncbi:Protein THO1, partial [Ooceraea biroi]